MTSLPTPEVPRLQHVGNLVVQVGEPLEVVTSDSSVRRAVPVLGGTMSGEIGEGVILSGWDYQEVLPNGAIQIDATYPVRLTTEEIVTVNTTGIRFERGDAVPYFRLLVTISRPAKDPQAPQPILVAVGHREAGTVLVEVYRLT